jgi:hypothetical protein
MRATHISSVRTYIEQDQALVPPAYRYSFSWPNVQSGDPVLAKYFTEMRQAIQLLWDFKGRPTLPNWTSGVTPGGPSNSRTPTVIRASDVTDLRLWLNQYEDNHAPKQQGIDSKSYDPSYGSPSDPHPIVLDYDISGDESWNWVSDISQLTHDPVYGPLYVRTVISSPNAGTQNPSQTDFNNFNTAFSRYTNKGVRVYALLDQTFYTASGQSLNDNLSNRTNSFITGFANRAALVSQNFSNVDGYIIWNEPNVLVSQGPPPVYVNKPENFAALLYQCRQAMGSGPRIYWGGIQVGPGYDGFSVDYIGKVYKWYDDEFHVLDPSRTDPFTWPWVGINLHFHNDSRSANDISTYFTNVRNTKVNTYGDNGEIIIGEWGVRQDEFRNNNASLTNVYTDVINNSPDIMFFFAHHGVRDPVYSNLYWGIRDYVAPDVLVQQPPGSNPLAFRLASKAGINGDFYNAYDALIGN